MPDVLRRFLAWTGFLLSPSLAVTGYRPTLAWVRSARMADARPSTAREYLDDMQRLTTIMRENRR